MLAKRFQLPGSLLTGFLLALSLSACTTASNSPSPTQIQNTEHAPTAQASRFYWVISSDPQFPRVSWGTYEFDETLSRQLITEQYNSINAYRSSKGGQSNVPVFINGDITEFYHGNEIKEMKALMAKLGPSVYYGLGNHDYDNNVNDCWYNGCARDAVRDTYNYAKSVGGEALDMTVKSDSWTNYQLWRGSLAYAKTLNDFVFLQLHNHPAYKVNFKADEDPNKSFTFDITQSLDWLQTQLQAAKNAGKHPIINMHRSPTDENYSAADIDRLRSLVSTYGVKAIFYGHTHIAGKGPDFAGVPTFNSGAAFAKTFLVAEYNARHGEVVVKKAENNSIQSTPLGTIKISEARTSAELKTGVVTRPKEVEFTIDQPPLPYLLWKSVTLEIPGKSPITFNFPADKEDGQVTEYIKELTPDTTYNVKFTAVTDRQTKLTGAKAFKTAKSLQPVKNWCARPKSGDGPKFGWLAEWERGEGWGSLRVMYELNVYKGDVIVKQVVLTPDTFGTIPASIWHTYNRQGYEIGVRAFNMQHPTDSAPPRKYLLDLLPGMHCN